MTVRVGYDLAMNSPDGEQSRQRCGEIPRQAQKNDIRKKRQTIRKFFKKQFRFTPVISPICEEVV